MSIATRRSPPRFFRFCYSYSLNATPPPPPLLLRLQYHSIRSCTAATCCTQRIPTTQQRTAAAYYYSSSTRPCYQDATTTTATTSHTSTTSTKVPFYGLPRATSATSSNSSSKKTLSLCLSNVASVGRRWEWTIKNAATAWWDPTRADAVAAVGELTGEMAIRRVLLPAMQAHPVGQVLLHQRPLLSKSTLPYAKLLQQAETILQQQQQQQQQAQSQPLDYAHVLRTATEQNPQLTLGQAYGLFLKLHGFDPDERDPVLYLHSSNNSDDDTDDDAAAYVMLRYRQVHDFAHALTGLSPTVLGELALKWLELFQTGLPMTAAAATLGSLRLSLADAHALWTVYLPWAVQTAHHVPRGALLNVYYEHELETPLVTLRQRLGIQRPAPIV